MVHWCYAILFDYVFCMVDTEHRGLLRKPKKRLHSQLQRSHEWTSSALWRLEDLDTKLQNSVTQRVASRVCYFRSAVFLICFC